MTARDVAEEDLFGANTPTPKRELPDNHPITLASRQYIDSDQTLAPWMFWALAPVERAWLPLADGTECVWLTRNQKLRCALVDYRTNQVVSWRLKPGSTAYRPRRGRLTGRRTTDPP